MENEIQAPTGAIQKHKVEPARKTFFFERHDGSTFCVGEREAWTIMKGGNKVVGIPLPPPKFLGMSDGTRFRQAVIEAHTLHGEGKIEEAKLRLRQGEQEELAAARGNIQYPRNFDTIDRNGNPAQR